MHKEKPFSIVRVRSPEDLRSIVDLFREYARSLDIDLTFQGFEEEVTGLPGKYAFPTGELLLARNYQGDPVGCVGLRALGPTEYQCCEMKRLYTVPSARRMGIGWALVSMILDIAHTLGYKEIKLDTLSSMESAISLYKKAGFVETGAYYDTPIQNTVFFAYSFIESEKEKDTSIEA